MTAMQRSWWSTPARRAGAATVIGAVPVVVVLLRFAVGTVTLDGDEAIFAMQVRDAATGGFPTLGLYSRYGWSHPGPIAFYVFAPFQVFGSTLGILIGAAAWNVVALGVAVWLAARRGGNGLVAVVIAAQCATWLSIGGAAVVDPWTPNLAAVLVVPLLLAAWGAALGDRAAAAALLVLGSIAPQIHIGYAVIVVALGLAAVVGARDRRQLLGSRQVLIGAVVAVALWAPVAIGELTGRTRNTADLWEFFREDEPTAGLRTGVRVIAGDIGRWPSWLGGGQPTSFLGEPTMRSVGWVVLFAAALLAAVLSGRRTPGRRAPTAVWIAACGLLAGVVAGSQVRGPVFHYLTYWRAPIIMFAVLALALCVLPAHRPRVPRAVGYGLAVAAVIASAASGVTADQVTRNGDEVGRLLQQIDVPDDDRILVRLGDSGATGVGPGLLLWLEQRGVTAGVDPSITWVFGDRGMQPGAADEIWYALDNGWSVALLSALPGARVVAEHTPLDDATAARVVELQRSIAAQLTSAGVPNVVTALDSPLITVLIAEHPTLDAAAVEELAGLNALADDAGLRNGIVAFDPADAPTALPWPTEGF